MKLTTTLCTMVMVMVIFSFSAIAQDSYKLDEVYNIDTKGTLHLDSEDANVVITGSDRKDVHVFIERIEEVKGISSRSGRFEVEVDERDGDLFVRERKSGSRITMGVYRLDYDIIIELPRSVSLRIVGEDDDYDIKNVNGPISLRAEDGDVEIADCMGSDFEFELEDGDIRMDKGNGSLYINVEDGDADIRNGNFDKVEVRSEDGDVMLETTLNDSGTYDFDGDDANLELIVLGGGGAFDISKDDGRVSATGDFDLIRESDSRVEYTLGSGKADVRIRTNDGRVRLSKK